MRAAVREAQAAGEVVGFVPTMGALHEGHLSLIDAARAECDRVVISVFVNPTQFGAGEDFDKYPRPLERDLELASGRGCDWAFVPEPAEIYPPGFDSYVDVGAVAVPWEGAARPGHFRGVATVVLKLFELVPADRAFFGRKDYQQTLVVERLVADFNLATAIRVCPIIRDADGLALSSRNAYLSADERRRALALSRALRLAEALYAQGERSAEAVRRKMLAEMAAVGGVEVEYVAIVRDGTVEAVTEVDGPTTVAIAARVGRTRLIDNCRIG
jgi:pantoate--beta-alanine ligase